MRVEHDGLESGRDAGSVARGTLRRLVEQLEVHEVERLDGVALLDDARDAASKHERGSASSCCSSTTTTRGKKKKKSTHLISLAP